MPMTKTDTAQSKELTNQINAAVTMAIHKVLGPQYTVKILTGSLDMANLIPQGQNLVLKMSIDLYPKTE